MPDIKRPRLNLKRYRAAHPYAPSRVPGADADALTPMMKAIKAVHSVTSTGSTQPEDLERQRSAQELFGRLVTPNRLINTTPLTIGTIPAEWVRMNQGHDRRHVVLYCHGGGYTCGQLGYARVLASKLALTTGCDVLSFEYRLAPEHPYPAAVEDAQRVWDYLMFMGIGAHDVIVAGDSAGGNLALELALTIKQQGRHQPRALILMSPWTDLSMSGPSMESCRELDPMLTETYIDSCRIAYRGIDPNSPDWTDPRLSPLFGDLRGLPPTLIQVGSNEILKSDAERLYESMRAQGVYASLEIYAECWHVFQQMPTPHAAQAMDSVGRFVQRML
ncbi:MAG: alpha/beta hydrolase [Gemmiger sp.]|uniref:alpha/beta hydrolase n=1 Tax=Gemmiger sp. TaxID=2049027 RepID=UPI002E78CFC0|nr:alpha/beta hydrolase [Gemmiger sp.]MEE0799953.1 alpha/beta hydrolase [Gemmiger sp.]